MVGIVIVSHSHVLAQGVCELVRQACPGGVSIAAAGGTDDPDQPLGTDATKIHAAIEQVGPADGVVLLVDMGSAILSAETAIELLPPNLHGNVRICAAPLVEGAVAAGVTASSGGDLETVIREATRSFSAKARQMGQDVSVEEVEGAQPASGASEVTVTMRGANGLHMRPAAQLVQAASRFQSTISVRNVERPESPSVSARSLTEVSTLGVGQNDRVAITADGPDADDALVALRELFERSFDEWDESAPQDGSEEEGERPQGVLVGVAASDGVAIGPAIFWSPAEPEVVRRTVDDVGAEWERLRRAIEQARREIDSLRRAGEASSDRATSQLMVAYELFLVDPVLVGKAHHRIIAERVNAESAWQWAIQDACVRYESSEDQYTRERGGDIREVGRRVLCLLAGLDVAPPTLEEPHILLADELDPSVIARLPAEKVLGIALARGGPTSHAAIMARARGIPAVMGIGRSLRTISLDTLVAVDGHRGYFFPEPDDANLRTLRASAEELRRQLAEARAKSLEPAVTRDGVAMRVLANVADLATTCAAIESGAEGIGLLRTEFLFRTRRDAPTEEEQYASLKEIVEAAAGRHLVVRTLDIGGDKPVPYWKFGREANPLLGQRGIRWCLEQQAMFKTHFRAIFRAASHGPLSVMLPMIASSHEVHLAKQVFVEALSELEKEGLAHDAKIKLGIMVEVPSAVELIEHLLEEVSFVSIGTNDLSQYAMAADRTNAHVASLVDALHPAVLSMVRRVVIAGKAAGRPVCVCGEVAADPLAVPLLVGLGVREVSVSPPAVPRVKEAIRALDVKRAETWAKEACRFDSADEVRHYVEGRLER
ncbi:Phosphoenolpyruvate-protein phosphotransferase [Planctomycetes bacterium Pan216]|uniref:Phosphoenolpyruvate-protein phosphotransferase n=1 Tax=Kolteria novifilia TaxID=2527975 RepID=A0A518BC38_9BACT|nr:Phosphoenolpyruvate-protein phosphotransferase [Planctomycetes bacterium Pan216]